MSKVKALVTLVVFAVLLSFTANSFAVTYPGDRAGWKADYLWKKLKLTNDEYTKVYQTLLDYEFKVKDMKVDKKADKKAKEEKMKKLQADVDAAMMKALPKEKLDNYNKMKEKFWKKSWVAKKKVVKKESTDTEKKEEVKKDVKKEEVKKEEKKK